MTTTETIPAFAAADAALIRACVQCAGARGTHTTAAKADPLGNCEVSGPIIDKAWRAMIRSMGEAAILDAQTFAGLSAKARVVLQVIMPEARDTVPDQEAFAFLWRFAEDVKRFADGAVSDQYSASKASAIDLEDAQLGDR